MLSTISIKVVCSEYLRRWGVVEAFATLMMSFIPMFALSMACLKIVPKF
jgi:hypothetical protein